MDKVSISILQSIKKNGFPEKTVTLPFKAIFDSCKKHQLKLSDVLKSLEPEGVISKIGNERITFISKDKKSNPNQSFQESEVFKSAMDKLKDMDPNELESIKQKVMNMSEEERSELLEKAQNYFKK